MRAFSASGAAVAPLDVVVGGGTYHFDKRVLPWRFCSKKKRIWKKGERTRESLQLLDHDSSSVGNTNHPAFISSLLTMMVCEKTSSRLILCPRKLCYRNDAANSPNGCRNARRHCPLPKSKVSMSTPARPRVTPTLMIKYLKFNICNLNNYQNVIYSDSVLQKMSLVACECRVDR